MTVRAVFYDRDGVINKLIRRGALGHTSPWTVEEFDTLPHVEESVRLVRRLGYLPIVATNQPAIANREMSIETLQEMHETVIRLGFHDIFYCPHNDDSCECRKPKPGLIIRAAWLWDIDLPRSFFVGDSETDMLAASAAGCTGILLRTSLNGDVSWPIVIQDLRELERIVP